MSLTITRRSLFPVGLLDKQTVSDTAVGLDFTPGAINAEITVETEGIRWRDDGVDPTPTVGKLIDAGSDPFFYEGDLSTFKMIRASGLDATVQTLFYNGGPAGTKWDVSDATIAHYKLNESAPNKVILDASGNAFNGVLEGGKTTRDVSVAGLVSTGTAFDFDDVVLDRGNIDAILGGISTNTKGTIAFVVEPDDIADDAQTFISINDTDTAQTIGIFQEQTDGIVFAISQTAVAGVNNWRLDTDNVVIANGVKTWIVLVHDGISPKFIINGVETPSTFIVDTNLQFWFNSYSGALDNARIGSLNTLGGERLSYDGTIDDLRFLNRDLTTFEAAAIHNNGLGTEAVRGVFP